MLHRIYVSYSWQPSTLISKPIRTCNFVQHEGFTLACFDGAALSNVECCGAGGTLKFQTSKVINWFIDCGSRTNTKAELMGLWATLTLANHCSIEKFQVLGDSKVIIDWINKKGRLHAVHFEGWKLKTIELVTIFQDISFHHIYRDHNKEADSLSKRALREPKGRLTFFHWESGIESQHSHLNIFEP